MTSPASSARHPRVVRRGARVDWIKFDAELSRDGSVDPVDKALYAAIASFCDTETRESPEVDPEAAQWDIPTRKRLAECIGRSVDTVDRSTKRLETRRLLRVHRQADPDNPRRMLPSEYELLDHELWDQRAADRAARRAARRPDQGTPPQEGGRTGAATPGRMDAATPGRTSAAEYKRRKEGGEEEGEAGWADAVGQGDGGFARDASSAGAGSEASHAQGGSAASEPIPSPRKPKTSPRPKTVKTRPRQMPAGYDQVRAAIPHRVARPGTQLYVGLRRAIADLLTGNPAAGIPSRTPEQVIARINRRWYGEHAEERCETGYSPATDDEGAKPIKNPSSWLAAAILAQDCPNPECEDGQILGTGQACAACRERRIEEADARRGAEKARALWEQHATESAERAAERHGRMTARQTYERDAQAAEQDIRQRLSASGLYGGLLDHHTRIQMDHWRATHPAPSQARSEPSAVAR